MSSVTSSPRRQLSRDDWAAAALQAIAEGGLAAVAVEPLAARLGTTKGSFYWHFRNRDALVEAALAHWEAEYTNAVTAEVDAAAGSPLDRLRLLVKRVVELAERDRVALSLLASEDHSAVRPVLLRVTAKRIAYTAKLFGELGFPAAEARRRALLAYSAYLGHAQLAHATPGVLLRSPAAQRAYLDDVVRTLTARAT